MRLFGFAGWSGSGKTTLIERIVPRFIERGLTVSLIKHAHHDFDLDQPGRIRGAIGKRAARKFS